MVYLNVRANKSTYESVQMFITFGSVHPLTKAISGQRSHDMNTAGLGHMHVIWNEAKVLMASTFTSKPKCPVRCCSMSDYVTCGSNRVAKAFPFLSFTLTVLSPESLALRTTPLCFIALYNFPAVTAFFLIGVGLLCWDLFAVHHSSELCAATPVKEWSLGQPSVTVEFTTVSSLEDGLLRVG